MKHFYNLKTKLTIALIIFGTTLMAQDIQFSMQGILKNFDGTVVQDGEKDLTFKIWDAETGGNELWSETQTGVYITGGVYNIRLGEVNQVGLAALPFTSNYWVGITVESGANPLEMTPRIKMTGSAYNYRSKLADYATYADTAKIANVALSFSSKGAFSFSNDVWNPTNDGVNRLLFATNSHSYYKTGGTGSHIFKNPSDEEKLEIKNTGEISVSNDVRHTSLDGVERVQYVKDSSNFYKTGGAGAHVFKNESGANTFDIQNNGSTTSAANVWHKSDDGINRLSYSENNNTFFWFGSGYSCTNSGEKEIMLITSNGAVALKNGLVLNSGGDEPQGLISTHRGWKMSFNQYYSNFNGGISGYKFYVGTAQLSTITTDGSYTQISDRRLKTNIKPLTNVLDKVMKLEGVSYKWDKKNKRNKDLDNDNHIGVIAQDIEKVYPEFVNTNEDDGYKTVNYSQLSAVLIQAVKELNEKIENQNEKISTLKADNSTLEENNSSLDARLQLIEEYLKLSVHK